MAREHQYSRDDKSATLQRPCLTTFRQTGCPTGDRRPTARNAFNGRARRYTQPQAGIHGPGGLHLKINGVDFLKTEIVVGPWLEMDTKTEQSAGNSPLVARANELARGTYRSPFVVPEDV